MANDQEPIIRVISFKTTYEVHPKRGSDPLNDTVDEKGFLLNDKGKRIMENIAVDWVTYAPAQSPLSTQNTERVMSLAPGRKGGTDGAFMKARWAQIEAAYLAWKNGQDIPVNGMPLSAWPGVNSGQVDVLRHYGIRSVEEVRDLTDSQIERIRLPNMQDVRKQARLFLENTSASISAQREAEKDAQLVAMQERLAEMEKLLDQKTAPASKETDTADEEVTELRAELDAKGIAYDKRWAAPKLRAALTDKAA
ncbi:hypothetical protein [Mesorhizobium sp. B2-2-2]|uniref:hypothetical protein n=1 Tax=Mesorhizobium sp. B2-2-2 TaxID=2589964 RepID=UPI0015E4777C|nr:hypothetical protein [Mesorhizobium sp. B2-2-2]